METVKLTSQVQVRTKAAGRNVPADSTVEQDAFLKLLQQKKELAGPDKKTEKTEDSQKTESTEAKKDSSKESEEPVKTEDEPADLSPQEVLLQAGLQQAAVQIQMSESASEIPKEAVPEILVQAPEAGGEVLGQQKEPGPKVEAVTDQEMKEGDGVKVKTMTASEEKSVEPAVSRKEDPRENRKGEASLKEEEGKEISSMSSDRNSVSKQAVRQTDPEPSVQTSVSSAAVKEKGKAQPGQETGRVGLYGGQAPTQRSGQLAGHEKTEIIPLRTSHSELPQDLGKTLASRLPGNGRELIIELEPASLGKLTIKMVYEGSRAAVSILASNPRTLELLSQKASEIASILEEKTGQETVIYTQAPEREDKEPEQNANGGQGRQQESQERRSREDDRHETESFAQQLRLGLV